MEKYVYVCSLFIGSVLQKNFVVILIKWIQKINNLIHIVIKIIAVPR